jgi:hypothetical protein
LINGGLSKGSLLAVKAEACRCHFEVLLVEDAFKQGCNIDILKLYWRSSPSSVLARSYYCRLGLYILLDEVSSPMRRFDSSSPNLANRIPNYSKILLIDIAILELTKNMAIIETAQQTVGASLDDLADTDNKISEAETEIPAERTSRG